MYGCVGLLDLLWDHGFAHSLLHAWIGKDLYIVYIIYNLEPKTQSKTEKKESIKKNGAYERGADQDWEEKV